MRSAGKGHQRTSSSPISFPITHGNQRENNYVHTAPRLSDSESTNERSLQRILGDNALPTDNSTSDVSTSFAAFSIACLSL